MNTSSFIPSNKPGMMKAMNTSSFDALAQAALINQHSSVGLSSLSVSPSSSLTNIKADSIDTSKKLAGAADPSLIAAMASRRSSLSMMPLASNSPQGLSASCSSGTMIQNSNNHAIFLSILNEQRRRASLNRGTVAPGLNNMATSPSLSVGNSPGPSTAIATGMPSVGSVASLTSTATANNNNTSYASSLMQPQLESSITSRRRKPNFAEKLHAVLSNKDCRHAIAWLPSGRSFCITDQDELVKKILPKYFREAKFDSFSRRLKRWGFRKVYTTGLSQVIFSHDQFHRDRPDLCKVMKGHERVSDGGAPTLPPTGDTPFGTQDQQYPNAMMLQQQQQFLAMLQQQQMNNLQRASMLSVAPQPGQQGHSSASNLSLSSLQQTMGNTTSSSINTNFVRNATSSPEHSSGVDAQAVIKNAQAIVARSITTNPNLQAINREDPHTINEAKMQLTRLNDDIANCEEQIAILHRLRRRLTGSSSSPPSLV